MRDHFHRQYNGRVRCCCGWDTLSTGFLTNRCDYRRLVTPDENINNCRDANEEHGLSFEGGCNGSTPINSPISEDESKCWEINRFGYTDDGDDNGDDDDDDNNQGDDDDDDDDDDDNNEGDDDDDDDHDDDDDESEDNEGDDDDDDDEDEDEDEDEEESEDYESEDYESEDYESEDYEECEECTDEATPWMERNEIECETASMNFLESKCRNNRRWTNEEYCMWTCFERDLGYDDIVCC